MAAAGGRTRAQNIGLVLGLAALVSTLVIEPPAGISPAAWTVAGTMVLMAIWWATEALPFAATALVPLAILPPLGAASASSLAARLRQHDALPDPRRIPARARDGAMQPAPPHRLCHRRARGRASAGSRARHDVRDRLRQHVGAEHLDDADDAAGRGVDCDDRRPRHGIGRPQCAELRDARSSSASPMPRPSAVSARSSAPRPMRSSSASCSRTTARPSASRSGSRSGFRRCCS